MKVYLVIEHNAYEFEHEFSTSVCSTREKAKAEWERRVSNVEIDDEDEDMVIDENADRLFFDAYKDGCANEWECEVWVEEKEVDEE